MLKKPASAREVRLLGWIGWSGLDAFGRLALLTGSTIVFSRILTPHDFGVSALILTIVTFAAIFVGAPFEDALTQRRNMRMAHLRAALGASWLAGLFILAGSIPLGRFLAIYYAEPQFHYLLPVAMISIFFGGHSDILTALARRHRRFNEVSYATLGGHIIGITIALAIAFMGYGIWALIAQRLLVVIVRALILQWRIGFLIVPGWSFTHIRELSHYAGISFFARITDNLTYLVFNTLVQMLYGFTTLGHVNMAMRLIEPIRGAIVATSHNLGFSFFMRASGNKMRLRELLDFSVSRSAFVIAPVFAGMAAVAPVLLPIVTGKGWGDAVQITICLSVASAIALPPGLIYTASSASGRPEFNLYSLVGGLGAIVGVLVACSGLGPISVGLSRIAGDLVRAVIAIALPSDILHLSARERLATLTPAWAISTLMGLVVAGLGAVLPIQSLMAKLIVLSLAGIAIYGLLLRLFARSIFDSLAVRFRRSHTLQESPATP